MVNFIFGQYFKQDVCMNNTNYFSWFFLTEGKKMNECIGTKRVISSESSIIGFSQIRYLSRTRIVFTWIAK